VLIEHIFKQKSELERTEKLTEQQDARRKKNQEKRARKLVSRKKQ